MRCLILMLVIGLTAGCSTVVNKTLYQSTSKVYRTPDKDDLDYEDVAFASADGTMLTGWFIPATYEPRGTVIHLHGNTRNMTSHYRYVGWIADEGFNVFVFDYRGYGQSAGTPDRKGIYEDCVAAVRYVQQRDDVNPERVIVIGQSLGAANAIAVLGREKFDGILGIVAEAPFASYEEIVTDDLATSSGSISRAALGDAYSPAAVVDKLGVPLIVIHGTADRVVPYKQGKRLFDKAKEPKQIWTIKGGRHCDSMTVYKEKVRPRLLRIFRDWATADEKKSFR